MSILGGGWVSPPLLCAERGSLIVQKWSGGFKGWGVGELAVTVWGQRSQESPFAASLPESLHVLVTMLIPGIDGTH